MRIKIILGFTLVGLVLFFAAVTSYLELSRLTTSVQLLIDRGAESVQLSNAVLDILQEENTKVMSTTERNKDSIIIMQQLSVKDMTLVDSLCNKAIQFFPKNKELADIAEARDSYYKAFEINKTISQVDFSKWYLNSYNVVYSNFNTAIKRFMLSTQDYVVNETAHFKANIYRTTMQSLVALCVSIFVLFVFFLLIDVYFIKPVTMMTKSLDKYLGSGISFNTDFEAANEPAELRDHIKTLIDKEKKKKDYF